MQTWYRVAAGAIGSFVIGLHYYLIASRPESVWPRPEGLGKVDPLVAALSCGLRRLFPRRGDRFLTYPLLE